jgi:hypothetical protein
VITNDVVDFHAVDLARVVAHRAGCRRLGARAR